MSFLGQPVRRGHRKIGYIPQQRLMEAGTPLRARDMIAQGVTGHRWGVLPTSKADRARIDRILDEVGATAFADAPVAELSGGEQQRTRVGQAIAADPALLLCDEPLISLDLRHQRGVTELIDRQRRQHESAVLFVTHDVNPILDVVDRVLYIAGGRFRIGSPDEVLRADVLSDLYGTPVDVVRTMGRIVIVGANDAHDHHHGEVDPHAPASDEGRI
jgi:zinc/manganese transport system ATP-binding protein